MSRVILFGGSFDPIHEGHLTMAKHALKQRNADELWFIVSAQNPFKQGSSDFKHRINMVQLMINPYRKMKALDIEAKMPIPSYSIDTVKVLQTEYPDITFEWLIGSDQLESLHRWKDFECLNQKIQFIVYAREAEDTMEYPRITGPVMKISSTQIRKGEKTQTAPAVLRYMSENGLYLESILSNRVSLQRFEHVKRVCEVALELAAVHSVDLQRMYLAAMMHDLCKEDSKETLTAIMEATYPRKRSLHPAFYHGFAAASELAKRFYIRDKQVLNAIRGHVNGDSTNKIGMILYIADKCERGRGYDSEPYIHLAKQDLNKGFKAVKQAQDAYLRRPNE